jgi:heterodisulfide reductase subunit A
MRVKTGVFICHCGHNIKHTVDVKKLSACFRRYPSVSVSEDYPFVCSELGQDMIRENIEKHGLDRVIIASCTPSLHQELFKDLLKKSNLNPFLLRRVGIREHCSWVGDDVERNTEKARQLIVAGLYSASHYVPLEEKRVDVAKSALVIGGGVSGLAAAAFLSQMGMRVCLVEKESDLGGRVKTLGDVWPTRREGAAIAEAMAGSLSARENVEILTSTTIRSFEGSFGNYEATLDTPVGERKIIAGGVIVAIGYAPTDPRLKPELNYGTDQRIITTLDFERDGRNLSLPEKPRVAILHCVGSRDEQIGKPYCSRVCCINALRVADAIKKRFAESYVESFYTDVRAHPRGGEEFFEDTQEKGVLFTRSNVAEIIPTPNGLLVKGEDTLLGETFEREFDLAVLSIGMSPPEDCQLISSLLKISLDKDRFFLEAHVKLRPYDTALKGIFIAGACSGPKDIEESISHGRASAVKLFGLLNLGYAFAEPFISFVNEKRCSGCRMCEQACVARAIKFDEAEKVVRVEEAACTGCGLCNSTCPSSAITLRGYDDAAMGDEIGGLLEARVELQRSEPRP